jgi:hypothetical protein
MDVFAGGLPYCITLTESSSTTVFRSLGGGIYLHDMGWGAFTAQQRRAVLEANCGAPFMFETGFGQGEAHDKAWATRLLDRCIKIGLVPNFLTSNCYAKGNVPTVERWKSFCKDFRDVGYTNPIYPILNYSNYHGHKDDLAENGVPDRKDFQEIIAHSGGIAIDTAGKYFLKQPEVYQNWIYEAITWARDRGYYTISYASPHWAQDEYLPYTIRYIAKLQGHGCLPHAVIIGSYRDNPPPDYINVVGREFEEHTGLNVGLTILKLFGGEH